MQVIQRTDTSPACLLPKLVGKCRGAFEKWYFNVDAWQCETFIYGGCDGNDNNFETQRECEQRCLQGTILFNTIASISLRVLVWQLQFGFKKILNICRRQRFIEFDVSSSNRKRSLCGQSSINGVEHLHWSSGAPVL